MATSQDYLNKINETNNQIDSLVNNQSVAREQNMQSLRDKYKYQDKVNTLENLKKNAMDTDRLLSDLPTNIKRRTAGRLMTSGQRDRLQAAEAAPIAKQYADISRGISTEQSGLDLINRMISEENAQKELGYQDRLNALRESRAQAGQLYTTSANNELEGRRLALQQSIAAAERQARERAERRQEEFYKKYYDQLSGGANDFEIEVLDEPIAKKETTHMSNLRKNFKLPS